jgi:cobalt-precorrin 5A hydrolase / precorrin-3B C17-methyltransferase
MARMTASPALVLLGAGSLPAARRVRDALPGAVIHGLAGRVPGADIPFDRFGTVIRHLFGENVPIVAFCAAGIVIRALAPLLQNKRVEPPVLAIAEDGSAVVPLLGGLRGVNTLAQTIGRALGTRPAITTTGEVRFGATLEHPPDGYVLRNPEAGKRIMSDLLAGERVRLDGDAPWLRGTRLPLDPDGRLVITVTAADRDPGDGELVFHPRAVAVAVAAGSPDLPDRVRNALARRGLAAQAVATIIAADRDAARPEIHAAAAQFGRPLRLVGNGFPGEIVHIAVPDPISGPFIEDGLALAVAAEPLDVETIGRARGRLAVVGLGPGGPDLLAPLASRELAGASDIVGYRSYVEMIGPPGPGQAVHASDNREEIERARHALTLAAAGRSVAVVSSGDPGVFAMATALLEALHLSPEPAWHGVELAIVPGISAAHAAAARAGAPLGHDFCVLSLSDNLKPWEVIERRLDAAAAADLVLALYNPVSRARPWQLGRAVAIVRRHRAPETPVVLGRNLGRSGETVRVVALENLPQADIDMRTVVIIGSSTTRMFPRTVGGLWAYTPRSYGSFPPSERCQPGKRRAD